MLDLTTDLRFIQCIRHLHLMVQKTGGPLLAPLTALETEVNSTTPRVIHVVLILFTKFSHVTIQMKATKLYFPLVHLFSSILQSELV